MNCSLLLHRVALALIACTAPLLAANFSLGTRVQPRTDFPVFHQTDCELRINFLDAQNRPLDTAKVPLRTDAAMKIPAPDGAGGFRLEIWRAGSHTASWTSVMQRNPRFDPLR